VGADYLNPTSDVRVVAATHRDLAARARFAKTCTIDCARSTCTPPRERHEHRSAGGRFPNRETAR
jgi:hypothetical protein